MDSSGIGSNWFDYLCTSLTEITHQLLRDPTDRIFHNYFLRRMEASNACTVPRQRRLDAPGFPWSWCGCYPCDAEVAAALCCLLWFSYDGRGRKEGCKGKGQERPAPLLWSTHVIRRSCSWSRQEAKRGLWGRPGSDWWPAERSSAGLAGRGLGPGKGSWLERRPNWDWSDAQQLPVSRIVLRSLLVLRFSLFFLALHALCCGKSINHEQLTPPPLPPLLIARIDWIDASQW